MRRSIVRLFVVCAALTACGSQDDPAREGGESTVAAPSERIAESPTDEWTNARISELSGPYIWYDPGEDDDDPPESGVQAIVIFGVPSSDDTAVSLVCRIDGSIRLGSGWLFNGRGGARMEMRVRVGDATETVSTTLDGGNEMDPRPNASISIANRSLVEALRKADTLTMIGREVGTSEWAGFRVRLNDEALRRFAANC